MLEEIQDIDWSRLSHAYGPAMDVPALLRALATPNEDEREAALDQLYSTIWHQGSVYDATAAAVPFLIEIAEGSLPPWRERLVDFLGEIAWSTTYGSFFMTYGSMRRRNSLEVREAQAADAECKRATRMRLAERWDFFEQLSESSKERSTGISALAILLEHFHELPIELEPAAARIIRRWGENLASSSGRQDTSLALARASKGRADALNILRKRFHAEEDRGVRSAIALALFDAGELLEDDCFVLLKALSDTGLSNRFLAWRVSLGPRIARVNPAFVARHLSVFAEIFRNCTGITIEANVKPLLPLFFGPQAEKPTDWQRTPDVITDAQAEIIRAIIDNNEYWGNFGNARLPLLCYGLPKHRQALRRLIARPGRDVSPHPDSPRAAAIFQRHVQLRMPRRKGAPPPPQPTNNATQSIAAAVKDAIESRDPSNEPSLVTKMHLTGEADDALVALLPACMNLTTLTLDSGEVTDAGTAYLGRLSQLTNLSLGDCLITDACLEHLKDLHRLQELNLSYCPIDGSGFCHLRGATSLHRLNLSGTNFRDAHFAHLASFALMRVLSLIETPITGDGFAHISQWHEVEELYLDNCPQLTDAFLPHIRSFERLKKLHCTKSAKLRGQRLDCLVGMQSLERLNLDGTGIDDQSLAQLPRLAALSELRLGSTSVTASGLANLARNPSIKRLNLTATHPSAAVFDALADIRGLERLDLSKASITDAALAGIERLPNLRSLNLSGTQITDAAVTHLVRLANACWISLEETALSDEAIAELRVAFPKATIVI